MAAGEGRRLRPLSERWAKPVLPIDGRPLLALLLRELAAADFERVWLVTGHLAEQVEKLAGDGSAFGLEVRFVRQPRVLGSADAVRLSPAPGPGRNAVRSSDGRVERMRDDDPANPWSGAPLWALGQAVADRLCLDRPPYELENAFQSAIDAGETVMAIEIGKTRDLTDPLDLVEENFPYLRST